MGDNPNFYIENGVYVGNSRYDSLGLQCTIVNIEDTMFTPVSFDGSKDNEHHIYKMRNCKLYKHDDTMYYDFSHHFNSVSSFSVGMEVNSRPSYVLVDGRTARDRKVIILDSTKTPTIYSDVIAYDGCNSYAIVVTKNKAILLGDSKFNLSEIDLLIKRRYNIVDVLVSEYSFLVVYRDSDEQEWELRCQLLPPDIHTEIPIDQVSYHVKSNSYSHPVRMGFIEDQGDHLTYGKNNVIDKKGYTTIVDCIQASHCATFRGREGCKYALADTTLYTNDGNVMDVDIIYFMP